MEETEQRFSGDWKGFSTATGQPVRVILKIRWEAGSLQVRMDTPDRGGIDQAMEDARLNSGRLTGSLMGGDLRVEAVLEGENTLTGQVWLHGTPSPLQLVRDNPAFRRFDTPRLNASSQPVTDYIYQAPDALPDGLETAHAATQGVEPALLEALVAAVLSGHYPQTHAILIARRGRLILEEYFYGHARETLHTIQSVTKSVTSILFGIAQGRGEIGSLDTPVYTYFPGYGARRWVQERYPITLRHLLTMTAALDWQEDLPYIDPRNDNTAMNRSEDWIAYVLDRGMAGVPGERFMYTSGLSILLGAVLQRATDSPANTYAEQTLFAPLGIRAHHWFSGPNGAIHTGGGLSLCSRDLLKIGLMMGQGGRWQGRPVAPAAWVAESTRRQTNPDDYGYGYQWHIRSFQHQGKTLEAACGIGYGGQFLFILPQIELVVVFNAGLFLEDTRPLEKMDQYILPAVLSG